MVVDDSHGIIVIGNDIADRVVGVDARLLFLHGHAAAEGVARGRENLAPGGQYIRAAEAERGAGGVQDAVLNQHVEVVEARHAVVAGVEFAFADDDVVAADYMDAVVPREVDNVLAQDVRAVPDGFRPVGAVLHGVPAQDDMTALNEGDAVRAAVILLAQLVVAVVSVDD